MTVDELGQRTKAKHSEYGQFSDSEVGARVLSKYPEYRSQIGQSGDLPTEQGGPTSRLGATAKAMWDILPENPKNLLRNTPLAAGALGGAGAFGVGAVLPTLGGQGIRYAGDKAFDQPVPSPLQHVLELGGAALGDAVNAKMGGKEIGQAMGKAGLSDVTKAAPPSNVRTAIKLAQQIKAKGTLTPQEAAEFKPAVDSIFSKGWLSQKAYSQYAPDVAEAKGIIIKALNTIPGREQAASKITGAMTIPNAIQSTWQATRRLPLWAQIGLGIGAGGGGGLVAALKNNSGQ